MMMSPAAIAAAPPLSLYGNLPGFERAAISASGEYIAIIGVLSDQRRLIVVDKNDKPVLVAPLDNAKVRAIQWAGDRKVLLMTSNTVILGSNFSVPKAELSSMVVISIPDGKLYSVFATNSAVTGGVRGFYGTAQRGGRWYGYFGGFSVDKIQDGALRPDLFEVDLDSGRARLIADRGSRDIKRDWIVDGQGKVAARLDFSPYEGKWWLRDSEGRILRNGRAPEGDIELLSLGRSPGTIAYVEGEEDSGGQQWWEIPVSGGTPVEIASGENILSGYVDNASRRLLGHSRDGDVPQNIFYDPERQKIIRRVERAFPQKRVAIVDWSDRFDRLVVRTDGPGDPQSWWIVDVKGKSALPLGVAYPLSEAEVGPIQTVRYQAADGLEMSGILTLPPGRGAKNLPVLVLPHGGPADRDYPVFDWLPQAFASRGYAVFQPNFRGSTGFGAEFRNAGRGEWGRKMQTDISDGLSSLARQGIVDPKRACIMGASYGGYAALAGVTLQRGLYRCAISVAGISDLGRHYQQRMTQSGSDRTVMRSLRGEIGFGRDLKDISPARFAAAADAPILLIHGKDDTVVPFEQSNIMADALKEAKKPVWLLPLKAEDHWLSRSTTRQAVLTASIDFIQKHNPPDPAP